MSWKGWCTTLTDLVVATIYEVYTDEYDPGISLIVPPSTGGSVKHYKRLLTGETLAAGDLVLCAKVDGTYVVLGKIAYS